MRGSSSHRASMAPVPTIAALWKAAKQHDAALVKKLLLEYSAMTGSLLLVNEFYAKKGTTPLMIACKKKEKAHRHPARSGANTVQMLLEFGADMALQAQLAEGHTALHYAAISNQVRAVEFMLHAGVDAFALNSNGHAAIDLARWHRSRDVLDVLTQHARIHSGWLYVKKLTGPVGDSSMKIRVWKKRWVVALAGDATTHTVELSLYKDPFDIKPTRVILLKSDTHALVSAPKKKWLDRHNMFHVDRPLVVQKATARRRFSRTDQAVHTCEAMGDTMTLQFAAESPQQRDAWMAILRVSRRPSSHTRPGTGETFPPQEAVQMRFPSPISMVVTEGHVATALSPFPTGSQDTARFGAELMPSPMPYEILISSEPLSPRRREEPSAPTFIDDLEPPALSFYHQASPAIAQEAAPTTTVRSECVICMDAPRDAICVPCGHVAGCQSCLATHVMALHTCPICRASVASVIKIYEC